MRRWRSSKASAAELVGLHEGEAARAIALTAYRVADMLQVWSGELGVQLGRVD